MSDYEDYTDGPPPSRIERWRDSLEDAAAHRFNAGTMVTRFDYSDLPPREAYVADQMHREFARRDFIDRLEAHSRLNPHDEMGPEHFKAFDVHRRAQHEARWDGQRYEQQQRDGGQER